MNALLISFLLVFPLFVFGQANKYGLGIIRGTVVTADGQAAPNVSVLIKIQVREPLPMSMEILS
jgi:hypothetical protein